MKQKWFYILFGLLLTGQIVAQKTTNEVKVYGLPIDTLQQMVAKHPKYFKHLIQKWQKAPGKMSEDEMMLMYYGSCFFPDYNPVQEDKAVENIAKMTGEMDFENAIMEGEKLIKVYPLNPRLYMLLGYAAKKTGLKEKSKFYYKKYGDILRVPLYSGKGNSFENSFIIRIISDEYLILNQRDLELLQQELRYHNKIPYDVLRIKSKSKENKRNQLLSKEKLYFNIYLPFFIGQHHTYKMIQEDAKRKYKVK